MIYQAFVRYQLNVISWCVFNVEKEIEEQSEELKEQFEELEHEQEEEEDEQEENNLLC